MELLRFQNVSKDYGHRPVLDDVTFRLGAGDKAGLIGANGAGKTTILRLLLGQEKPSGGVITRASGLRLGYVPQYVEVEPGATIIGVVLADHTRAAAALRETEQRLAVADAAAIEQATRSYDEALAGYERAGGDLLPARAEAMLDAFGLGGRGDQPVEQLSGGERNVLSLAQALLAEPDLLVLDEPGNHLDFAGLAWLERFLSQFRGAVLMVSHNRYLLDRVAGRILHLHDGTVDAYAGNYSAYRAESLRQKLAQRADYVANQKRLDQLEELVRRFREIAQRTADPAWGKRLRARKSQLERERAQAVEKPAAEAAPLHLSLSRDTSKAEVALQVRGYTKAFGERTLFSDASMDIRIGQRVAIIGPNGCGKTTFLRDVLARGSWDDDVIRVGPSLRVGYCAQEQDVLDDHRTVLGQILVEPNMTRERAFAVLARFMFGANDLDKRVGDLSGGERNRLQLARLSIQQPDFLILDEPTNHLDIPACEAIEDALADFTGTLLLVSHDRYLLDKAADHVVEVIDGRFEPFTGNFSEYWSTRQAAPAATKVRVATRRSARERPRTGGSPSSAASQLQTRIEAAEREREALEKRVSEAFTQGDHREGSRASHLLEQQQRRIEELYRRWLAEDGG
ncbi:MAG: ABC-F family ATP-binding cassette domain-containing protein [Chloroflexi bacterium]|nr:ABC-F family ATP-binding cassette domain-containing protein [Chloroflexota bacterium]